MGSRRDRGQQRSSTSTPICTPIFPLLHHGQPTECSCPVPPVEPEPEDRTRGAEPRYMYFGLPSYHRPPTPGSPDLHPHRTRDGSLVAKVRVAMRTIGRHTSRSIFTSRNILKRRGGKAPRTALRALPRPRAGRAGHEPHDHDHGQPARRRT